VRPLVESRSGRPGRRPSHRIGQDRPVTIYRLIAVDTVEERILDLQEKKRALGEAALGDGGAAASLTREDLMALLA